MAAYEAFFPREKEAFRTMLYLRANVEAQTIEFDRFNERLDDPNDGLDQYEESVYRRLENLLFVNNEELTLLKDLHPKVWELVESTPYLGWEVNVGKNKQ